MRKNSGASVGAKGTIPGHGYAIEDATTRKADLEDVFVQLTSAKAG